MSETTSTSVAHAKKELLPLERFLRSESRCLCRAWIFFGVILVFCTGEILPGWTHPDLYLNWPRALLFWIIAAAGAVTGWVVARYRLTGLLCGALAGSGSLLMVYLVFTALDGYSRYAIVLVEVVGLLPGIGLYCVLHLIFDRFVPESSKPR